MTVWQFQLQPGVGDVTVNSGGGVLFSSAAAQTAGGGSFTVDDQVNPLLVNALRSNSGIRIVGSGGVATATAVQLGPPTVHQELPAAPGQVLALGSDGYYAPAWQGAPQRISASQMAMYGNSQFTMGGTNTLIQSNIRQRTARGGRNVCLLYQSVQSTGEQNLGGDGSNITIRAAVTDATGSAFWPAYTQDGNRDATLTPNGGICRLWVPGFEVQPGVDWYVRTRAVMGVNGAIPFVNFTDGANEAFYGPTTGTTDSTTAAGAFTSGSSAAIAPNLITYQPWAAAPCVLILGDSIGAGKFDPDTLSGKTTNAGGWCIRALSSDGQTGRTSPLIANVNMANESESTANVATPVKRKTRMQFADEANCTTAFVQLGVNDIAGTAAALQANLIKVWTACSQRGMRVLAFTITPVSSSSDNWATQGNQTTSTNNPTRIAVNQWLRAGAPMVSGAAVAPGTAGAIIAGRPGHPVYRCIDICPAVETVQDQGKWISNGVANTYTADGLHPNPPGYALLAQTAYQQAVPLIA